MWGPYDHMDHGWGGGQWAAMAVMMVLFLAVLAVLVVWFVRATSRPTPPPSQAPPPPIASAEQVLAERFARGEIDEEEFTRRRALLRGSV